MDTTVNKRNAAYNSFGTFFYFFCQWLLTILVVRLSGYEDAGIFSLSISITNVFYCISLYGMRNYQVSDITGRFTDSDYIYIRLLTIAISLLLFAISLCFLNLPRYTLICTVLYMGYKMEEAISDLLFALNQKYDQYRNIAVSYVTKGVGTLFFFVTVLAVTKSLLFTIISNIIIYAAVLIFYDWPGLKYKIIKRKDINRAIAILSICFPLMLYSGLVPLLNFVTRYIVEVKFGTIAVGYFSSVTMVFSVLSTLMNSIFVTIIPNISYAYQNNDESSIKKLIRRTVCICVILLIIGLLVAHYFGELVFTLVFGQEIVSYLYLLTPTIISAVLLSLYSFLNTVLISIGKNNHVLSTAGVCAFSCICLLYPMTLAYGMNGTALSLLYSLFLATIVTSIEVWVALKNRDKIGYSKI